MDYYGDSAGLDPLRDPAPRRPTRIMSRSGLRGRHGADPSSGQPDLASSGRPRESVVRNPNHSRRRSHNEDQRSRQSDAYSRQSDAYSRQSDAYSRQSDAYSRQSDSHSRQSDSHSRQSGAHSRQSGAHSRQSGAHSRSSQRGHPRNGSQYEAHLPEVLEEDNRFVSGMSVVQDNGDSIKFQMMQLREKGFSTGLARELASNKLAFAYRIWVVDNSGSMALEDGHRITPSLDGQMTQQRVSRWDELRDTVLYHSELAGVLGSHTVFRLLNEPGPEVGPQQYEIRPETASDDLRKLGTAM